MRICLVWPLIVLLGFVSHAQQPAVVRGRVIDAATGAPLVGARIAEVRSPVSPSPLGDPVVTDGRGEFLLDGAPMVIQVFKAGYARLNAPTDTGRAILEVRVPRAAAITGRVVDRAGAPVTALFVGLFEIAGAIESRQPVANATTDDLGEYRFGDLKAGRYRVRFTLDRAAPSVALDVRAGDEIEVMQATVPAFCQRAIERPLPATATGKGILRGRVTTTANVPLACVTVSVLGQGNPQRQVTTDAQGRYGFSDLKEGSYRVTFTRPGYTVLQYGQERAGQDGKMVRVADDLAATDINVAVPRGAAITGTITDDTGDPVEGAIVRVLKLSMVEGRQVALPPQGTSAQRSDDRGRYRLYGLLPGRYLVSAAPDDGVIVGVRPNGAVTVNTSPPVGAPTAPMLFPGTPDPSLAALLTIEQGRDLEGIDIPLHRVPGATITGKALDSDGEPVKASVLLAVSQRSGAIMMEPRQARVGADGSFVIRNVPPGEYVLQTIAPRPGAAPDFAAEYVRVGDVNPAPVLLRTSPGPTIEGRIVREGPEDPSQRFMVMPFPSDFDRSLMIGMGTTGVTVLPDGTYRAAGMNGPRRMVFSGPDGWYLKSVTLRGRDITDEAYDFGQTPEVFGDLQVIVSNAAATIDGDVRERGNPVGNYSVVLFSTDRSRWFRNSRHLKFTRPEADGRFRMSGIAPGEYYLAAVDVLDGAGNSAEWQDPAVLEFLTRDARRVSLGESQQATYSLPLQRR